MELHTPVRIIFLITIALSYLLVAQDVTPKCAYVEDGIFEVVFEGPEGAHLQPDSLQTTFPEGVKAATDDDLGREIPMGHCVRYRLTPPERPAWAQVRYQACVDEMCFMPQRFRWPPEPSENPENPPSPASATAFRRLTGYADVKTFCAWLDGAPEKTNFISGFFRRHGLLLTLLLMLPLGLLLNLTPCVLPMIPITLGILGAGGRTTRRRGFLLGSVYGAAMALSYGLLGLAVVLAGGRFGGINGSPWFNLAIALIFLILGAAMFDWLSIDFSRWRPQVRATGQLGTAILLGAMTALLAGACIAPVLLWTLLLAAELHAAGQGGGAWLPLALGVGLALPWPFLGAGLSFLPRPGRWMARLKYAMGVVIVGVGLAYGVVAFRLWRAEGAQSVDARTDVEAALAEAAAGRRRVLLDFTGVSCKACTLMEKTTLASPEVKSRLAETTVVRVDADDFDDPAVASLVRQYGVVGLPTYILLEPK